MSTNETKTLRELTIGYCLLGYNQRRKLKRLIKVCDSLSAVEVWVHRFDRQLEGLYQETGVSVEGWQSAKDMIADVHNKAYNSFMNFVENLKD